MRFFPQLEACAATIPDAMRAAQKQADDPTLSYYRRRRLILVAAVAILVKQFPAVKEKLSHEVLADFIRVLNTPQRRGQRPFIRIVPEAARSETTPPAITEPEPVAVVQPPIAQPVTAEMLIQPIQDLTASITMLTELLNDKLGVLIDLSREKAPAPPPAPLPKPPKVKEPQPAPLDPHALCTDLNMEDVCFGKEWTKVKEYLLTNNEKDFRLLHVHLLQTYWAINGRVELPALVVFGNAPTLVAVQTLFYRLGVQRLRWIRADAVRSKPRSLPLSKICLSSGQFLLIEKYLGQGAPRPLEAVEKAQRERMAFYHSPIEWFDCDTIAKHFLNIVFREEWLERYTRVNGTYEAATP